MLDVAAIFDKLANTLSHLVGDSDVNKTQEKEIQATIAELRDFEDKFNTAVDERIAQALAAQTPAAGSDADLSTRVNAIEKGLESLGHVFGDTNTDPVHQPEDTTSDTVAGGSGDDTVGGGTGDDTVAAPEATDTASGGQGDDSVSAGEPAADTTGGGQASDTVAAGEGADTTTATA